jgi:hypothetical protein
MQGCREASKAFGLPTQLRQLTRIDKSLMENIALTIEIGG